jgi:hypothetical protein
MPRIHIARMRNYAPARRNFPSAHGRRESSNLPRKLLRFGWVEASSNCRRANHFVALTIFSRLTLRAILSMVGPEVRLQPLKPDFLVVTEYL